MLIHYKIKMFNDHITEILFVNKIKSAIDHPLNMNYF